MSFKLRWALPVACAGVLGAVFLLSLQSHASASSPMSYGRLNTIQKRIVSQALASALSHQWTLEPPWKARPQPCPPFDSVG